MINLDFPSDKRSFSPLPLAVVLSVPTHSCWCAVLSGFIRFYHPWLSFPRIIWLTSELKMSGPVHRGFLLCGGVDVFPHTVFEGLWRLLLLCLLRRVAAQLSLLLLLLQLFFSLGCNLGTKHTESIPKRFYWCCQTFHFFFDTRLGWVQTDLSIGLLVRVHEHGRTDELDLRLPKSQTWKVLMNSCSSCSSFKWFVLSWSTRAETRQNISSSSCRMWTWLVLTLGLSVLGSLSTFSMAVRASNPPTTLGKRTTVHEPKKQNQTARCNISLETLTKLTEWSWKVLSHDAWWGHSVPTVAVPPILRKPGTDLNDFRNLRPTSSLPFLLSKTHKKKTKKQLPPQSDNNLKEQFQHKITNDLLAAADSGLVTILILLDPIPHTTLTDAFPYWCFRHTP